MERRPPVFAIAMDVIFFAMMCVLGYALVSSFDAAGIVRLALGVLAMVMLARWQRRVSEGLECRTAEKQERERTEAERHE